MADPKPPHKILVEDFMRPGRMRPRCLALGMCVPQELADGIIAGTVRMEGYVAERLGVCFGTSAQLWESFQAAWDANQKGG